jgi:hypothetical protein
MFLIAMPLKRTYRFFIIAIAAYVVFASTLASIAS